MADWCWLLLVNVKLRFVCCLRYYDWLSKPCCPRCLPPLLPLHLHWWHWRLHGCVFAMMLPPPAHSTAFWFPSAPKVSEFGIWMMDHWCNLQWFNQYLLFAHILKQFVGHAAYHRSRVFGMVEHAHPHLSFLHFRCSTFFVYYQRYKDAVNNTHQQL